MDFIRRKRKSWSSDSGVSDVIGNILILMITVILFAGIIGFVQQMPVPQQTTKADFSASIAFSSNYRHANLTLVHAGGKVLPVSDIRILIEQDGTNYAFNLTDDVNFKGTSWSTGKPWTVQLNGLRSSSVIVATIADLRNSMMVWTSQVTGGAAGSPPNIQQRYVDSAPSTPTPDAVKENDTFALFVKVDDPDGDLANVWIDTSGVEIEGSKSSHWDWELNPSVGWYRWDFDKIVYGKVASVDGNVIIIHAIDTAGHETLSSYILDVTILPYDTVIKPEPVYTDLGTSGLPAYLSFISGALGHGFGFYSELLDDEGNKRGKADTDSPTVYFTKDENIFIRFASLTMSNVYTDNRLVITDTRTGLTFAPDYASASPNSTAAAPFFPYPTGGGAYVFECAFSTKNLPQSTYTISMYLKNLPSLGQTQQSFAADQLISVNQTGSPGQFMPSINLYKDSGYGETWGYSRATTFDISSSTANTVYVSMTVQNAVLGEASIAEVRITDLAGGSQVYGIPPAGSMMGPIGVNGNAYTFWIALRLNNGDMWLPGTNAYTLYVSKLSDSNEGVYSMSRQLWIKGSQGRADFFAGTSGMASGNSNFNIREYQFFIQNNNFFSSRVMWQSESTPGSTSDFTVTALGVGDIDDDGDKDLLMGQATSNALYLFENTLNQFGSWQSAASIARPTLDGYTYPITGIAFGDFSGDGHPDFAYATSNSKVVLYNVTYGSTGWVFRPPPAQAWSGTIQKIDLKDMTGDGRADLVMLAGGRVWIYDIKYTLDPLKAYQHKTLFANSTAGWVGTKDIDVEDVNKDGMLDILTTGTSRAFGPSAGVNFNLYGVKSESAYKIISGPEMVYGNQTGTYLNTREMKESPAATLLFDEETDGGTSQVFGVMRFESLPDDVADLKLRIRAIVYPGPSTSESFYVWVSPDNSAIPAASKTWSYVGEIRSTSWDHNSTVNFSLPSVVRGADELYVKFSDSISDADTVNDTIEIDYCAIVASTPGYTATNLVTDTYWTSVRGAEINDPTGGGYLEVVIAKDGTDGIVVYRYDGGWSVPTPVWSPTGVAQTATFYDDCAGKVNDATKYPFSTIAPTLFDAVDVNGDGFTDLLVCNYTTDGSLLVSRIGFWMNLYSNGPVWRYYQIKQWNVEQPTGQAKNPYIDIVVAASLTST